MEKEKQEIYINTPTEAMYRGINAGTAFYLSKLDRKKAIKKRIKEFRKMSELTQAEFCKKIDVNRITYAGYETGKAEPNIEVLCRIADTFDISLDYLCCRTNNPKGIPEKKAERMHEIEEKMKQLQKELDELK